MNRSHVASSSRSLRSPRALPSSTARDVLDLCNGEEPKEARRECLRLPEIASRAARIAHRASPPQRPQPQARRPLNASGEEGVGGVEHKQRPVRKDPHAKRSVLGAAQTKCRAKKRTNRGLLCRRRGCKQEQRY